MFRKLRRRTALYQLAIVVAMLMVVFAVSGVINYGRMDDEINENLESVVKFTHSPKPLFDLGVRNGLLIRVESDGRYKTSDASFYEEQTLNTLKTEITEGEGRMVVDGHYIAYKTVENGDGYYICIYDYTKDRESLIVNLIIIFLTGFATTSIVAVFLFFFTNKNLAPIEKAFVKQEELVANASHELKTPLTIVNTNLSILNSTSDELTDEQKKWLAGIGTQVSRMSTMINEMLLLARFEATTEKNYEKVDLSEIVETVVLETEALAFEKNIEMISEINNGVIIMARRADIEKLVYILVENALKYTEAQGTITVSLKAERRKAYLKVRNTGEGISPERLPKLFDRFYRVDEAHTESGSFGLGLAIAKAIADGNNGTIGVDSKMGEYTEFFVVFKEM